MIVFPNAKINIGLHIKRRRPDQYHDIETVFYPLHFFDVLEVVEAKTIGFHLSGFKIESNIEENICFKAYSLLRTEFDLPPVDIYLHKIIPIGAGLGGGSSDAAFMIRLLNEKFALGLSVVDMTKYARRLGADCVFFLENKASFAEGIGDVLSDLSLDLSSYHFIVVNPGIHIATSEAYSMVQPNSENRNLKQCVSRPIEEWKDLIINDFEAGVFGKFPEIREIKEELYRMGALYASLTGSGSSVFGVFREKKVFEKRHEGYQVLYC